MGQPGGWRQTASASTVPLAWILGGEKQPGGWALHGARDHRGCQIYRRMTPHHRGWVDRSPMAVILYRADRLECSLSDSPPGVATKYARQSAGWWYRTWRAMGDTRRAISTRQALSGEALPLPVAWGTPNRSLHTAMQHDFLSHRPGTPGHPMAGGDVCHVSPQPGIRCRYPGRSLPSARGDQALAVSRRCLHRRHLLGRSGRLRYCGSRTPAPLHDLTRTLPCGGLESDLTAGPYRSIQELLAQPETDVGRLSGAIRNVRKGMAQERTV